MSWKTVEYTADKGKYIVISSDQDRLRESRAVDVVRMARDKHRLSFTKFLDERGAAIALQAAHSEGYANVMLFGGYDGAERCLFGAFPEYNEPCKDDFPVAALTFRYRAAAHLAHRDFLGTLMSLGVKREMVGDILCGSGQTVIFVCDSVAGYIAEQINKVGGEGVKITRGIDGELPSAHEYKPISGTVASPRLDAVVGALCGISRSAAVGLINSGAVTLRMCEIYDVSAEVFANDKLSVRGHGKFIVDERDRVTRTGRIAFEARKYI
jgi:RNA-binding protein YlmH